MSRIDEARSYHESAMQRVASTPPPDGQKYPPGARVRITDNLGFGMGHFPGAGKLATVHYTYAHAYGGNDVKSYSLNIDGHGEVAWYREDQISDAEPSND